MVKILKKFLGFGKTDNLNNVQDELVPPINISVDDLKGPKAQSLNTLNNPVTTSFDGDKFFGGFGNTRLFVNDYWTLRLRSTQLFKENLYARGLLRRLITNEINVGLSLEAAPNGDLLGLNDEVLNDWSEDVENRFSIWAKNKALCDYRELETFGKLQQKARLTALINGDVLVLLKQSQKTRLPSIQLISGNRVRTPLDIKLRAGNKISHGVEIDKKGRHVAFWVTQADGTSKRLPAFGERSGRRLAWLVYGTEVLLDDVRGEPMLSLILQSLKEIDRYRDSAQRKAVINSVLAMFIKKGENKPGTRPMTGIATRNDTVVDNNAANSRSFNVSSHIPGIILDELQHNEEPVAFNSTGTDINFPVFEAAIINAIAWANEVPPEVLQLAFSKNYSASRGAVSELKLYLNKARADFGGNFCQHIYEQWLISEVLLQKIVADGLLESWRDPLAYDVFGAWITSEWTGAIKPSVDLKKEVDAYRGMIAEGLITRERAARELNGMKFSKIAKRLKQENKIYAEALEPLLESAQKFTVNSSDITNQSKNLNSLDDLADDIVERLDGASIN